MLRSCAGLLIVRHVQERLQARTYCFDGLTDTSCVISCKGVSVRFCSARKTVQVVGRDWQVLPEARNLAHLAADARKYFMEETCEAGDVIIKVTCSTAAVIPACPPLHSGVLMSHAGKRAVWCDSKLMQMWRRA